MCSDLKIEVPEVKEVATQGNDFVSNGEILQISDDELELEAQIIRKMA